MRRNNKQSWISQFNHKNLDFLGSEFQLSYTTNGRFQTKLGGFMWIGILIFMLAVAYSSIRSLISTDSPVATISNLYSRTAPRFDLYKDKMFFHLGFRNKANIYPTRMGMSQINRFITVKGFISISKLNEKTGAFELEHLLDLNYKPCSQVKDKRVAEDFQHHEQSKIFLENLALCPELEGGQEKYYIQSKIQDPPYTRLTVSFFPCSLPNPADCASISEFQEATLLHTQTKKAFDISNFEEPLTSVVELNGIQLLEPGLNKNLFF